MHLTTEQKCAKRLRSVKSFFLRKKLATIQSRIAKFYAYIYADPLLYTRNRIPAGARVGRNPLPAKVVSLTFGWFLSPPFVNEPAS